MKRPLLTSIFLFLILIAAMSQAPRPDTALRAKMQWFADAKLGIFIHTGIYAVNGIDESWSFHNKKTFAKKIKYQIYGKKRYDQAFF